LGLIFGAVFLLSLEVLNLLMLDVGYHLSQNSEGGDGIHSCLGPKGGENCILGAQSLILFTFECFTFNFIYLKYQNLHVYFMLISFFHYSIIFSYSYLYILT
jgi:hypothetical protein